MLAEFIESHRTAILEGARARVSSRTSPRASEVELTNGIPVFLDQLGDALRLAHSSGIIDHEKLGQSAALHGRDLFLLGLTIGQVVHDYGDVCQVISELAGADGSPVPADEFQLLNLCLDDAIAGAVTEYARSKQEAIKEEGTERLGMLAHELRNLLNGGTIAYELLKEGRVAIGGSTGQLLGRSLVGLSSLIDRSLADVRLDAGIDHGVSIAVAGFLEEIEIAASMQAQTLGVHLMVQPCARGVEITGDRQILIAALFNLLQNAFKFSHKGGTISLNTIVTSDRVLFEVEDECGGLPTGKVEELFVPFAQRGRDRSGLGLGLSICQKAAKASGGEINVRDLPGKGCVFVLSLPRTT
jgi:signal transduction histidine kinase